MDRIVEVSPGTREHDAMLELRQRLLRDPLGLAYTAAELEAEQAHRHLALCRGAAVIATLLLVPPNGQGVAKLRQMAVETALQGRGLGALLVGRGEAVLLGLGATTVALSARTGAAGFYERLGYRATGDIFVEVTLPHIRMEKRLGPGGADRPTHMG